MARKKAWKPTAFNFVSDGGSLSLTLTVGTRVGPSLSWGGSPRVWKCVQDEEFEQVLWKVHDQKDQTVVPRTGPTKRMKMANGTYRYVPDMKKIEKMYPEDFIEDETSEEDD